jgi:RNA polymerase sigma-70 factor (ECF subfamily)
MIAANAGLVDAEYPEGAPSGEMTAAALDDCRLLHRALLKMGQKYRTVIVLRYFEGKTLTEICDITNKREGTIKCRLHRALAQLKETLAQAGLTLR